VGLGGLGIAADRLLEAGQSLAPVAVFLVDDTETIVRRRVVGLEAERVVETGSGFRDAVLSQINQSQIGDRLRVVGFEADGLLKKRRAWSG